MCAFSGHTASRVMREEVRGFYTRGSRSLLFFPCSEHGGIQRVEMSLKFFAGTVVCHESKAVSTDHLHFVLICSSNVANGLGFFQLQSWRGKFSHICYEVQVGVVPFLYYLFMSDRIHSVKIGMNYLNSRSNHLVAFQSTVCLDYEYALKTFHELPTRFHDLSK